MYQECGVSPYISKCCKSVSLIFSAGGHLYSVVFNYYAIQTKVPKSMKTFTIIKNERKYNKIL